MAERRMFAKSIIDSDAFLDMPMSTQALYFHLSMRADDDGFLNNPKRVQRMIGATDDDLKLLIAKNFILTFESGVIVIKHWKIHNYIRNDRYKPTNYQEEKALLSTKENGAYSLGIPNGYQLGYQMDTQVRLGKDSIGKDNIKENNKKKNFVKPTIEEIENYINENNLNVNAQNFYDYYESNGWMVGHNHMKSYQATLRRWSRTNKDTSSPSWINKEIKKQETTKEELEELNKLLEGFNEDN